MNVRFLLSAALTVAVALGGSARGAAQDIDSLIYFMGDVPSGTTWKLTLKTHEQGDKGVEVLHGHNEKNPNGPDTSWLRQVEASVDLVRDSTKYRIIFHNELHPKDIEYTLRLTDADNHWVEYEISTPPPPPPAAHNPPRGAHAGAQAAAIPAGHGGHADADSDDDEPSIEPTWKLGHFSLAGGAQDAGAAAQKIAGVLDTSKPGYVAIKKAKLP